MTNTIAGKISCLMPTYNRVTMPSRPLDEAINSFLLQDYPSRELIILNDAPGQIISYEHPLIKIVNAPVRYQKCSDKMNALADLADGEYLATWDDDDIHLPWRLSVSVDGLQDAGYYNPEGGWSQMNDAEIRYEDRMFMCASAYRHELLDRLGGFPSAEESTDMLFYYIIPEMENNAWAPIAKEQAFYIYRWRFGDRHLSAGQGGWRRIGEKPIEAGAYQMSPMWHIDYTAHTRTLVGLGQ